MAHTQESLSFWNLTQLKEYLAARKVPLGKKSRKADLIEMVLAAQLLDLPIVQSLEEKQLEIKSRRKDKLTVGCIKILFPEELTSGWMKELSYYPDLTLHDVEKYAKAKVAKKGSREGFNLQDAKHVKNVEFNNISGCLRYCFIRGECVPQTRVNEVPYKVWVCVHLDSLDILTGECGCIAGNSESCKHIFGLLHYICDKVSSGSTKTCTSQKQKWSEPSSSNQKIHPPAKIFAVKFKRPHPERSSKMERKLSRCDFDPRPKSERQPRPIDWHKLSLATNNNASVLSFRQQTSSSAVDHDYLAQTSTTSTSNTPMSFQSIKAKIGKEDFLQTLETHRSEKDISFIHEQTMGQSSNQEWYRLRYGVITASKSHSVLAKYKGKTNKPAIDNLVSDILCYNPAVMTQAMKFGIQYESVAMKAYKIEERRKHQRFVVEEAGLLIHKEKPFIGASCDGYVSCLCHGKGNIEIKCLFASKSFAEYVLKKDSCLTTTADRDYVLKTSHKYHTQMQHQMLVTGAPYTDFVLYIKNEGIKVLNVPADKKFAKNVSLFEHFFENYILPEIYDEEIKTKVVCKTLLKELVQIVSNSI